MKKDLKPIVVLTLIAFFCTAALAAVNFFTKDIISKSAKDAEQSAMTELIPKAEGFEQVDVDVQTAKDFEGSTLYRETSNKGYIVKTSAKGYGGDILIMASFDGELTLTNVKVLSHSETKGVGTRAVESDSFLSQFVGKNVSEECRIDAVSGATVSSKGVLGAVNKASNFVIKAVKEG